MIMKSIVLDIMKFKQLIFTISFFVVCSSFIFAQTKNEVELRIEVSEFPQQAQSYIDSFKNDFKRIKYFKETDGTKVSYETKFKFKGHHFSVEFNKDGLLEDIEILIAKRHIPDAVFERIKSEMGGKYDKFRFLKIQKQYKNTEGRNDPLIMQHALDNIDSDHIFYEIITEVKIDKTRKLMELTFSKEGGFEMAKEVARESYEHVLY